MRNFSLTTTIFIHISVILVVVENHTHVCVLNKRPDPLNGGTLRWSLPYDQICKCQGVVAHAYKRPASYCWEPSSEETDVALWFIDDPRQLTLRKNWNGALLDTVLDRFEYCAASWVYIGKWSSCSDTCGGGTQTRTQRCVRTADNTASDGQCSGNALSEGRPCNENPCPTWQYVNEWSVCSATCYGGKQTRTQSCVYSDKTAADGHCSSNPLSEVQACNEVFCHYGECFIDYRGSDYRGVVAKTKSGKICQPWTSQSPHSHSYNPVDFSESGLGDHNYCRNPEGRDDEAWCYTSDINTPYEFCDIGSPKIICDALPQDCYDMQHYRNISGSYLVYPILSPAKPVKVWCDMDTDGGGWTVFQRRQDGSVDFYRNWTQYISGFGDVDAEFWLGNENIYTISNISGKTYDLRVDLDDGIETRFAVYEGFYITGSEDYYRLKFQSYLDFSNAGDSLSFNRGLQFSTYDQDHDTNPVNCAVMYSGAWWYKDCHHANLNGLYLYGDDDPPRAVSVVWYTWRGLFVSMKRSEMKIRPVTSVLD